MAELVLHLGAHKTATTALQVAMRNHENALRKDGTALVATSQEIMLGKGLRFVFTDDFTNALRETFEAKLSDDGIKKVIYSFEGNLGVPFQGMLGDMTQMYPDAGSGLLNLKNAAEGLFDRVRVCYSVRKQSELIESYYAQHVKEGHPKEFMAFLRPLFLADMSWKPTLEALFDSFGRENVEIENYSETKSPFDIDGMVSNKTIEFPKHRSNPSYGEKSIDIAKLILPHLKTRKQKTLLRRFLTEAFSADGSDPMPKLLTQKEKEHFDGIFSQDLEFIERTTSSGTEEHKKSRLHGVRNASWGGLWARTK